MIKNYPISDAILKQYPDAKIKVSNNDYSLIEWGETPVISESELDVIGASIPSLDDIDNKIQRDNTRENLLSFATVTTVAGNEFDANEVSQNRISRAIVILDGAEEIDWKLANNTWIKATKAELEEALSLAVSNQTQVWMDT